MNLSVAKKYSMNNGLLTTNLVTSNPFKSDAETDYEKKKKEQKKKLYAEILRVAGTESIV